LASDPFSRAREARKSTKANPFDNARRRGSSPTSGSAFERARGDDDGGSSSLLGRVLRGARNVAAPVARVAGSALRPVATVLDVPRRLVDATPIGELADVLRDPNPKGIPGFLRNLAVDVVEDPLTYVTFGTGSAAKVGLRQVTKALGKETAEAVARRGARSVLSDAERRAVRTAIAAGEGGSEKAAAKVMAALDRGGQGGIKLAGRTVVSGSTLRPVTGPLAGAGRSVLSSPLLEAFRPRGGVERTLGKDVAEELGDAAARARSAAASASGRTRDRLFAAARSAKVTDDELRRVVLPALDVGGGGAASVPERLRPLAGALVEASEESTARQLTAGVLPTVRDQYVPRRYTKAGRKALGRDAALTERLTGIAPDELTSGLAQGGHIRARTVMPEASIAEVEAALGSKLRAQGVLKGPLLEDEPLTLIARRSAQADRAVAQRQFLDEVAKITGPDGAPILRRAGPGVERPPGWVEFTPNPELPELGAWMAPREVAAEVTRAHSVVNNPEALREFGGLIGHLNTLWKGYATVPLVGGVGHHARNALGNLWNNFLAGVKNPADYARATRIQSVARRSVDALSGPDRAIFDLARRHGVLDEGFYLTELTDPRNAGGKLGRAAKGRKLAAGTLNPLSTNNAVIRSGRSVGSAVENNARLAHFISKLAELGSAEQAARSVRRYLFDYGDLTEAERRAKKVIGFYTFLRRNTPLQVVELARQPGKFAALAHTREAAGVNKDQSVLPDFSQVRLDLPFNIAGKTVAISPDTPAAAAADALSLDPRALLGRAGGVIPSAAKFLAEEAAGRSLFTGGPLRATPAERAVEALFPLYGKVKRAPYVAALNDDPQLLARIIAALTGANARVVSDTETPDLDPQTRALLKAFPSRRAS